MADTISNINLLDFLELSAKGAVVSFGLLAGCATVSPRGARVSRAIDIHHHYVPPQLIDEVKRNGKALGVEYFPPKTPKDNPLQIRFPNGNRLNPDPRMAEVPQPPRSDDKGPYCHRHRRVHTACIGHELDGNRGETWSKLYNEPIMGLVKRHPDRFAGIATVPLQDRAIQPHPTKSVLYVLRTLFSILRSCHGRQIKGGEIYP